MRHSESSNSDTVSQGRKNGIFAFVVHDGKEIKSIPKVQTKDGLTPCIGMTLEEMEQWKPAIRQFKAETNKKISLVRYEPVELIEV